MTERLYYTDSFLREFSARVVDRSPDGLTAYLDRTAFYPASGGQPCDTGTLAGVAMLDVGDEEERIAHRLAAPIGDDPVKGAIDWPRRFDHMQQHSGQHLLSAVTRRQESPNSAMSAALIRAGARAELRSSARRACRQWAPPPIATCILFPRTCGSANRVRPPRRVAITRRSQVAKSNSMSCHRAALRPVHGARRRPEGRHIVLGRASPSAIRVCRSQSNFSGAHGS